MTRVLVNFALIAGSLGFLGILIVILASFLSCCAGITTAIFHKILLGILLSSVLFFAWCMYHNCRRERHS